MSKQDKKTYDRLVRKLNEAFKELTKFNIAVVSKGSIRGRKR